MPFQTESMESPARPSRRRLLPVFLVVSAVLHATAVVVVQPPSLDYEPARTRVLEVVLVQSEPPRPLPVEPQPAPPEPRERAPESASTRAKAAAEPPRRADAAQPVLALPEPVAAAEPAALAPREIEKRAPPVEAKADAKAEVASAAPSAPGFSASYLRNPAPRYPAAARRAGEQGTVTLRVLVARDGLPARVDVEKSSGSSHLDAAALEAVRSWRFTPARQGAAAIESWVLVPIVFRLEGAS